MARKFYSVKSRNYKKSNWSRENRVINVPTPNTITNDLYQVTIDIEPSTNVNGCRTIGHIVSTITFQNAAVGIYWAIVYVPEGTNANALLNKAGSLYEPNQFVMSCGYADTDGGPLRISSHLKRRLHSGDKVVLVLGSAQQQSQVQGVVSYSIKYN